MIWYLNEGCDRDVIVWSSVTLFRNLEDYPFSKKLDKASCEEILSKVSEVIPKDSFVFFDILKLRENEAGELFEKGYLSKNAKYLFLSEEKGVSISLCAGDHIEIRAFSPGLSFENALKKAKETDNLLDGALLYAYDKKLGYICESPFNLGCAAVFSSKIFIPALYESMSARELDSLFSGYEMNEYCEGGYFYTVKTLSSFGFTEDELVSKITNLLTRIANAEREKESELYFEDTSFIFDRIMRSLGAGRLARLMPLSDMTKICADIRLGISLGINGYNIKYEELDGIVLSALPYAVLGYSGKDKKSDAARAEILSKALLTI